jgi:hypothetical protein
MLFIAVGGNAAVGYILICTFLTDILGARAAVASLMGYGISVPPAKEQSRSARARFIAWRFRNI